MLKSTVNYAVERGRRRNSKVSRLNARLCDMVIRELNVPFGSEGDTWERVLRGPYVLVSASVYSLKSPRPSSPPLP